MHWAGRVKNYFSLAKYGNSVKIRVFISWFLPSSLSPKNFKNLKEHTMYLSHFLFIILELHSYWRREDFPKIESLGGYKIWGINLKRGVDVEMGGGGCHFFITLQIHHIYCVLDKGSLYFFSDLQPFELAMQDSHPSLHCTITLYHFYISDPFW